MITVFLIMIFLLHFLALCVVLMLITPFSTVLCVAMSGLILLLYGLGAPQMILVILRAVKTKESAVLNKLISSSLFRLGLDGVDIYISKFNTDNVYLVQSFFGRKAIVVGKNVLEFLDQNEIDAILKSSIVHFTTKIAIYRTLLFASIFPLYILKLRKNFFVKSDSKFLKVIDIPIQILEMACEIYSFPLLILSQLLVANILAKKQPDKASEKLFFSENLYFAAKSKIISIDEKKVNLLLSNLFTIISLIEKDNRGIVGCFLNWNRPRLESSST